MEPQATAPFQDPVGEETFPAMDFEPLLFKEPLVKHLKAIPGSDQIHYTPWLPNEPVVHDTTEAEAEYAARQGLTVYELRLKLRSESATDADKAKLYEQYLHTCAEWEFWAYKYQTEPDFKAALRLLERFRYETALLELYMQLGASLPPME